MAPIRCNLEYAQYASHPWRARSMKCLVGVLAAMFLVAGASASQALVRIANDRGGQIGRYVDRYEKSASLRTTDHHRRSLRLGLHNCPRHDPLQKNLCNSEGQPRFPCSVGFRGSGTRCSEPRRHQRAFSMYPSQVRRWIARRGGLSSRMMFLRGRQLEAMYRPCYRDAQVAAPR